MHKTMEEIHKMCEVKNKLTEWIQSEVNEGKEYFSCPEVVKENGAIIDMIKDLSEAEKNEMEKKYYEMMICAVMTTDESMEEAGRMGYDNWRFKSSGQFAPKGHGTNVGHGRSLKMGFEPWPKRTNPYLPTPMYDDSWATDTEMGDRGRMGYPMDDIYKDMDHDWDRITDRGRMYEDYKNAKKHYTQTRDEKDKHEMNAKIVEKANETLETMGEMWTDADPETRKKLKMNLTSLLEAWEKNK